ncbi:MAG: HAMP domain-containing histidine kinase, partial [Nitrospinae bacterium]|nr:HAMP domain-containing histidine kinase [Nitrospinota bacterium]
ISCIGKELKAGRYVRLSVKDSGSGIPKELLNRIFEPFYTTKGVGKGTGLGLYIVKQKVEDHRGGISIFSRKGHGSEFEMYFPVDSEISRIKSGVHMEDRGFDNQI